MSIALGKNKKILAIFIVFLFLILSGFYFIDNRNFVVINSQKIKVDIADEKDEQIKGLSVKENLGKNRGMLFVFQDYGHYPFWMKNMSFPIDIIWIQDDKIIEIDKNIPVSKTDKLKIFTPSGEVNYVLEVNAGYCDKHNIKVGDSISFEY